MINAEGVFIAPWHLESKEWMPESSTLFLSWQENISEGEKLRNKSSEPNWIHSRIVVELWLFINLTFFKSIALWHLAPCSLSHMEQGAKEQWTGANHSANIEHWYKGTCFVCQCILSIFPAGAHQFHGNILALVNVNLFLYRFSQYLHIWK